ncbi:MAG: metal ABC transporter permease [Planctomycetota bacterium]|nr:metal ABC transporter permease [Planctomycetota bacterium]
MNTFSYLTDPSIRGLYWPGVLTGIAIALLCAPLSVLVVLKRLAFIGQGISHAAFGGVGLAAVLGLFGASGTLAAGAFGAGLSESAAGLLQFVIITAFCVGAAVLVGAMSGRGTRADTAIGIVLVASMALGAVLFHRARANTSWESILFGSILNVGFADVLRAAIIGGAGLLALWWGRRAVLFWAFDEPAALAFGVRTTAAKYLVLTLLAIATVAAMKLAGVVLATALLVLPGATALQLSARLARVMVLSVLVALVGVVGGLVVSFELNAQAGACIVLCLVAQFAAALLAGTLATRAAAPSPGASA